MGILPQLLPLLKPLTILIGPAPLFYVYNSWQFTRPSLQKHPRRPLPHKSRVAIAVLLFTSLIYISILLLGGSENVFYNTKSRFVTSSSVLQTRLAKIRGVTPDDSVLLERLGTSLSERLNYAIYGPEPLTHCQWCRTIRNEPNGQQVTIGDATMYFLFSLPQILSAYLFHALILGITTTPFLTSSQISRDLRIYISYVLGIILSAELWILVNFDTNKNSAANSMDEVTWLHWDLHNFRYTSLLIISSLQIAGIYIIETRWIVLPPSMEDKLFQIGIITENVDQRIKLSRIVRGVVMKQGVWRERILRWWDKQQRPIPEDSEIPEEVKRKWEGDARNWIDGMIKIEGEE